MPFPEIDRVIYKKNPIVEVVCQLRFPRDEKISNELPAEFQAEISDDFQPFKELNSVSFEVQISGNAPQSRETTNKSYEFVSKDELWKVVLTSDSISIVTNIYTRWEIFREKASSVFSAFLEIYPQKVFDRIGLRYRDVIEPSLLNEEELDWGDMLNPFIAGAFGAGDLKDNLIKNIQGQLQIELDERIGMLNAHYGLVYNSEENRTGFLIDGDFFCNEKIEGDLENALGRCDRFHTKAHQFFRWCISEELHQRLEPTPITD